MKKVLLLGAGFSANWGGWLASEVSDKLIAHLVANPPLRQRLVQLRNFERLLGQVQREAKNVGHETADLHQLNTAISSVFDAMNNAFAEQPDLNVIAANSVETSIHRFLARFDAIFTLNQDLLLEAHYKPDLQWNNKWQGWYLPGVQFAPNWWGLTPAERIVQSLTVGTFAENPPSQPIYKLHGSVNWRSAKNLPLMIVGEGKSEAIDGNALLTAYMQKFREHLNDGASRVMVIGYSFTDAHIDAELLAAYGNSGMTMCVVNPQGLDILHYLTPGHIGNQPRELSYAVTHVSKKPLSTTFGSLNAAERLYLEGFIDGHP